MDRTDREREAREMRKELIICGYEYQEIPHLANYIVTGNELHLQKALEERERARREKRTRSSF